MSQGHTHPPAVRPFQGRRNRDWLAQIAHAEPSTESNPLTAARLAFQQQLAHVLALSDAQRIVVERDLTAARSAAYAGVAPIEASSADRQRHHLRRHGNRQLNRVIYTIAVAQRRDYPIAQEYLARKLREGKSRKEALRALKRQKANVVYRRLQADANLSELMGAKDVKIWGCEDSLLFKATARSSGRGCHFVHHP